MLYMFEVGMSKYLFAMEEAAAAAADHRHIHLCCFLYVGFIVLCFHSSYS